MRCGGASRLTLKSKADDTLWCTERAGADPVSEVRRAPWRANLGEEPSGRGLDVHVHDPGALWRMSADAERPYSITGVAKVAEVG